MPYTEQTLEQLALMYGTDKGINGHNYIPFYEKHLPENPKKILEIGVKTGSSIKMWKKYFPNSEIHGLDLFEIDPIPNIPGVIWHKGNQCDWMLLDKLRNEDFDIIIDDGSHVDRHQLITFFGLFNGKHYFIEDLACCQNDFYSEGLPEISRAQWLFKTLQYSNQNSKWHDRSGLNITFSENENITLIKCS